MPWSVSFFEESCRLEQAALLLARARECLKARRIPIPAEPALLRPAGERKKRAREHFRGVRGDRGTRSGTGTYG